MPTTYTDEAHNQRPSADLKRTHAELSFFSLYTSNDVYGKNGVHSGEQGLPVTMNYCSVQTSGFQNV